MLLLSLRLLGFRLYLLSQPVVLSPFAEVLPSIRGGAFVLDRVALHRYEFFDDSDDSLDFE